MRLLALLLLAGLAPSLSGGGLAAQPASDPLSLELRGGDGGVEVRLESLLEQPRIRSSLESGLPVRIRLVVELWRDRFVDAQAGRYEWRGTLQVDPLAERYRLQGMDGEEYQAATLIEAGRTMQRWIRVPLTPQRSGTFYYLARVEVETLSASDLDELRRWLRGDLGPAVEQEEVSSAFGRGLRRLLVRILGVPVQRHQARSGRFKWP